MSKQSKRHERQEAQKRREHQLGQEYGRSSQPCFGELQQISKNAPLRNRLQMCLGNYDDAQKTMNAFGLKSVVGTETVPTTPGVDVKHDMFLSKTAVPSGYSQMHGDVKDKTSSLSKLTTSMSYPKPKKHETNSSNGIAPSHQRLSYQQPQQPSRSSVSPKVTAHLSAMSSSQAPDTTNTRQASPVVSKQHVKPVVPRPLSRQDNHPKEKKEKTHHHHGKEKRPDKERIKLQQEKAHQKPPKLLNKPAPVKNDHPPSSSYEDSQVKRIELNSLNKTLGSGRPVIPSMPPSKSPHNRMIGKDSNIGVVPSGATVTTKPLPTKVTKPLPSPTVRTPFTGELFSESRRSPGKEKPDKNVVNAPLEVMTLEKKVKEKKFKKKKHKSKTSEPTKEIEKLPPSVEHMMVEFTNEPKVQPHVLNKKPMVQKPPSLDLSSGNSGSVTLKPSSKLLSPLLSPMEDSSQDTYLQKIFDEMAGPTSPFLPVIQTPYKTGSFTFGFPQISKPKEEVFTSSTTEPIPISQWQEVKQERQEVKQESGETGYWIPSRVSDISEADIASIKRNPFMDDMEQENGLSLANDAATQGGPQEDHDSSSSDSSGSSDSESEGELLLSAKSDFPDMDSLEDINFDVPIDTITPLRSNPSSFSFIMEPDHAQLEPPTHVIEPMSHFVMAPNLGVHSDAKTDHVDSESNSSGSEDGDSSSDEGSSDSDMDDVEDLFVAASTTTVDQTRSQLLMTSSAGPPAETTTVNHVTSSVAVTGPTIVNRPPTAMKRLRTMFAAVKPAEVTPISSNSSNTTVNTSVVQPLEDVTPITPVSMATASFDTKIVTSMNVTKQQPMATVTATTVTSETTNTSTSHLLPRKNNTKRMTSISSKPDSKNSMLSEDSSSDSEGEESGEVTNSESEDEGTKPKPPKQAKWDDTLTTVETPETSKLQLICSISRQYMRPVHTPASTPKSPPTARIRPIMVAPEKKFRDRSDSTSEEHTGRSAYPQQPRDSLYHRRSRSREDSHEPDYPPRNRDHMRPHNRGNSRSMRSSSPDHLHHRSTSRHRELPPPRGSSHWSHGWSNSSADHHYSYDYDYGSTSHHYPRRSRHTARLNKPEIYMEDARKLKHSGDRTSSEIEKAHYYLDAALTYMTYCVCKEEEGDPDKEVMSTTIRLLKHIVQSPGLNMLARDVYCEMLSALCLRSQSVLSMKLFNTLSNNESINRNQKILSEYFSTKNNPQGRRSPFVGVSPSYSPANTNTTGGGCGSGMNSSMDNYANPSCHSPSANVTIPGHIYNMAATQFSVTSHLFNSQETWRLANNISEQHRDFFDTLDRRSGPISLYSSMLTVVDWAKEGLRLLKNTRGTSSCRDY